MLGVGSYSAAAGPYIRHYMQECFETMKPPVKPSIKLSVAQPLIKPKQIEIPDTEVPAWLIE